jgi:hypothetical protein
MANGMVIDVRATIHHRHPPTRETTAEVEEVEEAEEAHHRPPQDPVITMETMTPEPQETRGTIGDNWPPPIEITPLSGGHQPPIGTTTSDDAYVVEYNGLFKG